MASRPGATVAPLLQRAFTSGELAPALGMRADVARYLAGLKTCRNFLVQRGGGVDKRAGFRYIATVKDSTVSPRLVPFIFEADDQTYLLEFGHLYVRFYFHGGQVQVSGVAAYNAGITYAVGDLVVSGGVNYYSLQAGNIGHTPASSPTFWYALSGTIFEVPTPYTSSDISGLQWTQSADVLLLTHPSYAPRQLNRLGHTDWTLTTFTTAPSISAPTGLGGSAGAAGTRTFVYVVTASKTDTFEESLASSPATIGSAADPTPDKPNALSWSSVSGAGEYYVYCDPYGNGIYGFIGTASTTSFNDVGFTPDYSVTPPIPQTLFASTNNYPRCSKYYQQRLVFANTLSDREKTWASKTGSYTNFSISTPLQDDDAVTFVVAAAHLSPVLHLVILKRLLEFTDEDIHLIQGDQDGVLRPTAINAEEQGYAGANPDVRPVLVGNSVLYVQSRGAILRDLLYDLYSGGFKGNDLTIFASHLFDGYALTDLAYAQTPASIVWAVRSDGTLLGLTFVREQDVLGWHRHDTAASGAFEGICVIPHTAANQDELYAVVKRHINGSDVRYIEKLEQQYFATAADAFRVDCGLTYAGAPVSSVSGLSHLEGQVVAVLGDGLTVYDGDPDGAAAASFTVSGGALTLPGSYSTIHVGLRIQADLETLDLDVQGTDLRAKRKRVQHLQAVVVDSDRNFLAGLDEDHLLGQFPELWESPTDLVTGSLELSLTDTFEETGHTLVRHQEPRPFTVIGLMPSIEQGN